jgi:hypothetical protein
MDTRTMPTSKLPEPPAQYGTRIIVHLSPEVRSRLFRLGVMPELAFEMRPGDTDHVHVLAKLTDGKWTPSLGRCPVELEPIYRANPNALAETAGWEYR